MKKGVFPRILEFIFRLVLGILFIYSALVKISDPAYFAYSVGRYKILPDFAVSIFSLTIPMLELLAGLAILLTKWLRESALLVAGMLSMFIIALVQALARGLEISCGCFGVPSVGGRGEIVIALVRDMMLIGFAIWLMSRPNTKIEPLRRMSKAWRTICLCGFGILLAAWFAKDIATSGGFVLRLPPNAKDATVAGPKGQGFVVSSGAIRPGEWNVDFNGVLEKAEREQYPMVLLHVENGCQHCARLEESIAGEAFRLWREDRVPLMAFVKDKSSLYTPETVKASYDFVRGIKKSLSAYPYVCVYWPHDGVTNRVAFCGRRGIMGGEKTGFWSWN